MTESLPGVHGDDKKHENHTISSITPNRGDDGIDDVSTPALPELCAKVHEKVEAFLNAEPKTERTRNVQVQSRKSLDCIGEALRRYSLEELSLSYNGGKDCLVLLILYLSALHSHYGHQNTTNNSTNHVTKPHHNSPDHLPRKLESVYILSKHPFTQVDDFVDFSVLKYHLQLSRYSKPTMREAFGRYLADEPHVRAIFVGTRRTDPHGADLTFFDPTDHGWPLFMRIHPVIDWHYAEIWSFIRELGVEYCSLYDMGYTSLGGTTDTHPNPALAVTMVGDDGMQGRWAGAGSFRPAYELIDDGEERLGRDGRS